MFERIKKLFTSKYKTPKPEGYLCSCCGLEHHDWPAIAYNEPEHYTELTDEEKAEIATLSSDFCVIHYPDQTSYFARCVLFQDVTDYNEKLDYGIWVSLSEKSFTEYKENFDNADFEKVYFGWICNDLLGYDTTTSIPSSVYTQKGNSRPEVVPHQDFDHPFVRDYYSGISLAEAHDRIDKTINNS